MSTTEIERASQVVATKCAFCLADASVESLQCAQCGATHHYDCLTEAGQCAVCGHSGAAGGVKEVPEDQTSAAMPVGSDGMAGDQGVIEPGMTPAGWYPDPSDELHVRWWNGTSWTDATQPAANVQLAPASSGETAKSGTRGKRPWIIGGAVASAIGFFALMNSTTGPVAVNYSIDVAKGCYESSWGYADVTPGASVRVEDGSGTLLGSGILGAGSSSGYGRCEYDANFEVDPSDDGTYRVTIGNGHRGYLSYDDSDISGGTLTVPATLG